MKNFESTFSYKLIYVFGINDSSHKDLLKIGQTTIKTDKNPEDLNPNCKELNDAAKKRINQYTNTAAISYGLFYTELAIKNDVEDGKNVLKAFDDHEVHKVLLRSGVKRHYFNLQKTANEWFKVDLETVKNAIKAVKQGKASLTSNEITKNQTPIIFRPEQNKAIKETINQFKKNDKMLWNAKMRFGKTLTALQVAKEMKFKRTIIITHRPVVSKGWHEDFDKIFYDTDYVFGSKMEGEKIYNLIDTDKNFVYFASIQDLRGSEAVGGKYNKNDEIFLIDWNFVVIDEAHEGTLTKIGQSVIEQLCEQINKPKVLSLSGTPFNLLSGFNEEEIYTWDYVMEQTAKTDWDKIHFGDYNPYSDLPEMKIYTYDLNKLITEFIDEEDKAFNFKEFFRTWTGITERDFKPIPAGQKVGDFVHEKDVKAFLNLLCKNDSQSNYPFSTEKYRSYFRHSLWIVPGVKEAKALSSLLKNHPIFGNSQFWSIVNIAGDGDDKSEIKDAYDKVKRAFGDNPAETYSITISCGRLTTGVTVPEWTAVFMLAGSYSTSASSYLQTIFRVQSPANINGKIKDVCCVFDFAPDRTLKMLAEARKLSARVGKTTDFEDRNIMAEFLNYCPVIGIDGSKMKKYDVDSMLQQLKKAYTDRVVKNGFDDSHIYNENLLKLNDIELIDFENLKKIIGASKQAKKQNEIDINNQGLTNEQYEKLEKIKSKPKKELTPEEKDLLEELKQKKKNRAAAISILRGISIRIPLLIYGAEVSDDVDIRTDNLTELIDNDSWEEFMPKGVTKDEFNKFAKYYEQDVFVASGRQIRNQAKYADTLAPTERVKKIAEIFSTFKNPDKETVLTPWRAVNIHMSECLGGYDFYDEKHEELLDEPRFKDNGKVTEETVGNVNANILEINSKSGLYPLYLTYSIFKKRCSLLPDSDLTKNKQKELWHKTVEENIYVICKTQMAKSITKRTLLGYDNGKINAHAFDDLIMQLKSKYQKFLEKVCKGSFWNKEVDKMKFDAVVGNPPYQETVIGIANHKPIYHLFMDIGFKMSKKVSFITPARFLFNAGDTPDYWNQQILSDDHFKVLLYFSRSTDIFPNVNIKGGVAITYRDAEANFGKIGMYYSFEELKSIKDKVWSKSTNSFAEIILNRGQYRFSDKVYIDHPEELKKTSDRRISTSAFERMTKLFMSEKPNDGNEYIQMFGNLDNARVYRYFRKDYLAPISNLYKYKVLIPKANGSGAIGEVLSTPLIGEPLIGEPLIGYTETYISAGATDNKNEAEAILKYVKTKFARALLGILKVTQNNPKKVWEFVPMQDFTEKSDIDWTKSVSEIDRQLYKKYNFSQEEIDFIEEKIKPME